MVGALATCVLFVSEAKKGEAFLLAVEVWVSRPAVHTPLEVHPRFLGQCLELVWRAVARCALPPCQHQSDLFLRFSKRCW